MSRERKRGQLRLEGANPMAFVEQSDAPVAKWTPEQEEASRVISSEKYFLERVGARILPQKLPQKYSRAPGELYIGANETRIHYFQC